MPVSGTTGFTTYDLSVGTKLDVEDMIWLVSPFDVPLQGTNGADGRTTLSSGTTKEKKIEWLDEQLLLPSTTLGATAVTADTFITVATGSQIQFQTGDALLIDAEYLRVTGYGTTTDTLLVTRAYASSTAVQHSNAVKVVCVGSTLGEGATPPAARAVDRVDRFNLTQIFGPIGVQVSGTENAVAKYGLAGTEFDHQVANRTKEMFIQYEQSLIYGTVNDDTGNKARMMGGMLSYITSNNDSATTAITESTLLTQIQNCYTNGGSPDRILVGTQQKRNLSQINSGQIRYAQDTDTRGQVVDYYDSDFGRLSIVLNRWVRLQDIIIFSRDQATMITLRPAMFEMLAKTGDSTPGQVLMEKSLRFRRQSWAARFSGLTS